MFEDDEVDVALPDPSAAVLALLAGLDEVRAQVPAELPPVVALADAQALLVGWDRFMAVLLARVADVDRRQLHTLVGAPSTSSWVDRQPASLDRGAVALARKLDRVPHLADLVADGDLSVSAAERVAITLDGIRRHVDRPDGRIDGQPQEPVLDAVIVDGVLDTICEARGGLADDHLLLAHLVDLLTGIADLPVPGIVRLERAFAVLAQHVEAGQLTSGLSRLVDSLLPVQHESRADRTWRQRRLTLTRLPDGSGWDLRGVLDLECGELVFAILTAERSTDPQGPTDTAAWRALRDAAERDGLPIEAYPRADEPPRGGGRRGSGATGRPGVAEGVNLAGVDDGSEPAGPSDLADRDGAGDDTLQRPPADLGPAASLTDEPDEPPARPPRTREQRHHDAFKLACRQVLDGAGLGARHKVAPHLTVTVSVDTLSDAPGSRAAIVGSGTSWPRSWARRVLADSHLTRIVLSLGHRVLEVSHGARTLKHHERTALLTQWNNQCAAAGCQHGPDQALAPHHATPWHLTSSTSLADTVPLCDTDHDHHLHHRQQTLRLKDGRWLGPHGFTHGPGG